MSRTPRKLSEFDIYHVFARGVSRQQIFEDADDNSYFLDLLRKMPSASDHTILAYCLMSNHFHLLIKMCMKDLSEAMRRLEISYAQYFNEKYERVGTLFQGRFGSEPIMSDEQLLAAVRYIHLNPTKANMAPFGAFEWSSYREYIKDSGLVDTSLVLEMLGDVRAFEQFHLIDRNDMVFMEESTEAGLPKRMRQTDQKVKELILEALEQRRLSSVGDMSRNERDALLASLKDSGATIRQIERLTGISRGVIGRAWLKRAK